MFANISINEEMNKGKGVNPTKMKMYKHNYNLGRDEWQTEWKSVNHREFSAKEVKSRNKKLFS